LLKRKSETDVIDPPTLHLFARKSKAALPSTFIYRGHSEKRLPDGRAESGELAALDSLANDLLLCRILEVDSGW
jgi:hypothetical protein